MSRTISATEARVHFGELMRRVVGQQETVIVERSGEPQVVILSLAEYERLHAAQEPATGWQSLVARARQEAAADLGNRRLPEPEKIIRQMREERDAQLLDLH